MQAIEPLPAVLSARYVGWHMTPIFPAPETTTVAWLDGPGGRRHFIKVLPADGPVTVRAEVARLRWAAGRGVPVPRLLDWGADAGREWLVTTTIDAVSGIDPDLLAEPAALVAALGRGLRRLHDTPTADCPFDFSLDVALEQVRQRVEAGLVVPERDFHAVHRGLTPEAALARLIADRPATEELVLSHGDPCFPNYLLADGEVVAYVDLAELGLADRWYDLAVASWSTTWNVGEGFDDAFIEAYGLTPDRARLAYYRLLYDMRA